MFQIRNRFSGNQVRKLISMAVLAAGFSVTGKTHAGTINLVQNAGFETVDYSDVDAYGNLVLQDWNVSGITVGASEIYGMAHGGQWSAGLGAGYAGEYTDTVISQDIAVKPGDTYDISFWVAGWGTYNSINFDSGLPASDFAASFDDQTVVPHTALGDSAGDDFDWILYDVQIVATNSSATLEFDGRNDFGLLFLDDVSVTDVSPAVVVPLPASVWSGGVLLGALGMLAYRRRGPNAVGQ